jgi:ABC-type polysaccharide/polyol phosphate export permease
MTDSSRTQGGLICVAVVVVGLIFLIGVLTKSYWALALPVAALVFFVLGLTFWVGWTIATIRVEPEEVAPPPQTPSAGTASEHKA